ncbi:MAG: hypothetical protein WDA02_07960 [Saccharofermentanales bacterium]
MNLYSDKIILTREYFRVGFRDGESWDKFYFDNNYSYNKTDLTYATFITRKINNGEYLKKKEIELINRFYDKLFETKNNTIKELLRQQKRLNSKINMYDNTMKFLEKYKRKDKILKIINYELEK